jgi:hypothetical protein
LAVRAVGLGLAGMLLLVVGLILHTIVRRFQEIEHSLQVSAEDLRTHSSLLSSSTGREDGP